MLIRDTQPADAASIAAIYAHYVRTSVATFETDAPTSADWLVTLAAQHADGLPFIVADDAGAVIGFAFLKRWRPRPGYRHTVEDSVYLDPAQVGHGYGTALLAELLARGPACGARQVIAVIAESDDGASVALHRAAGFADAGRLRAVGHKNGRWIDTILMQLSLPGDG